MGEIQKADTNAQRRAVVWVLIGAAIGVGSIAFFEMYRADLISWVETNATTILLNPGIVVSFLLVLFVPLYFAVYVLFSLGSRIAHAERYPTPGLAVVRDTKIVTGEAAVLRGRIFQILSVILAAMPVIMIFTVWYVLNAIVPTS